MAERVVEETGLQPPADPPRRSIRPMFLGWGTTALVVGLIYWLTVQSPALKGLAPPVYVIAFVPAIIGTWQWFRPRQDSRRRGSERRRLFRRNRKGTRD